MSETLDEELFEKLHACARVMHRGCRHHGHPGCGPEGRGPYGPDGECCGPHGYRHGPEGECGGPHGHPHGPHPGGIPPHRREQVLRRILESGDRGIRQKDIAEAMHIQPSSLSELLDKLEADRYVERRADPEDRRATRIFLTEKGRARAYEIEDERAEELSYCFADLTDDEKREMIVLLDRILARMRPAEA